LAGLKVEAEEREASPFKSAVLLDPMELLVRSELIRCGEVQQFAIT
jgi:hypothetical protein